MSRWARLCGLAAVGAALPTVVWRVLVGFGLPLGTPQSWRQSQDLPGTGTSYVILLSAVQLVAALATLVLVVPNADRVPRRSPVAAGRRLPARLVVGTALAGAAVVSLLCVASAVNWSHVDPFRDADVITGWSYLCWACYVVAPAWPVLLTAATLGYRRARKSTAQQ